MTIKINGTNTAANPSITGTDTDTGIVYGSDQIDFSTGGSSKVTLNGSNLGVGVTNPSQKLHVNGSILVPSGNNLYFGDTGCKVDGTAGGSMTFMTNSNTAVEIDSSGKFGIGTSPSTPLHVSTNTDGTSDLLTLHADADGSNNGIASIKFTGNTGNHAAFIKGGHTTNGDSILTFHTDAHASGINPEERMRLDSAGSLNLGCTLNPLPNNSAGIMNVLVEQGQDGFNIKQNSTHHCFNIWRSASDGNVMNFYRGNSSQGGSVGIISINSSSTTYATSSDYRLKENEVAISDGITRLKTLKPYRFNFKITPNITQDGFFAHEAQAVVPEAITGTKDEVNENNEPIYQGIDQSKLVPLLTAALQEAVAKIEVLETKVAVLEAA